GLFNDGSLFRKVLQTALTATQREAYGIVTADRRRYRYAAKVRLLIAGFERSVPMTEKQRGELVDLVLEALDPPEAPSQYDYTFAMYAASQVPQDRLTEVFDEAQLRALRPRLNKGRVYEQILQRYGALAP
ncbi:MAG: hypothetical protein AAF961_08025, partial [Planctomycetota bacterium]